MALRQPGQSRNSPSEEGELRLTLGEHLEELRQRLFRSLYALGVGLLIGAFLVRPLYIAIERQVTRDLPSTFKYENVISSLPELFTMWIRLAFMVGLVVALPVIIYQLWGFIRPGLRPHERKPLERVVPISIVLFFIGAFLAWTILPPTMAWFASLASNFPGITVMQNVNSLVGFAAKMMLAFGIGFQLPLLVFFLTKFRILSPSMITRYWRHAVVSVFTLAAIATPGADPISMLVMAVPLTVLFFGSIWAARLTMKDQPEEELDQLD